jgi:hypothetical protein
VYRFCQGFVTFESRAANFPLDEQRLALAYATPLFEEQCAIYQY